MKSITHFLCIVFLISGCSQKPQINLKKVDETFVQLQEAKINPLDVQKSKAEMPLDDFPKTHLIKSEFNALPNWENENHSAALQAFIKSCRSPKTKDMYNELCEKAAQSVTPKYFLQNEFEPYEINTHEGKKEGLLTGYYEAQLQGSLIKEYPYIYPIYKTPKDLIVVDLSSIYPGLKNYRLRGRIEGNKLVPYYTRQETKMKNIDADIICYTDSKLDRFFLEIQGSGRISLDTGETIFVGYDNQNGHQYRAIGKYLVKIGVLKLEEVSMQTIQKWLKENPKRVDEVLNYNKSVVYFKQKEHAASGALGLQLTPRRSIAVDQRYIPLGSMLYVNAKHKEKNFSSLVMAQDTGGAIKGAIRADMFLGYGHEAREIAGELKSPLKLWILLPKNKDKQTI